MVKNTRVLALLGAAAIFASACSSGASPSSNASGAPSAAATSGSSAVPSENPGGPSASAATVALPTPEKKSVRIGLSVGTEVSQYAAALADQMGVFDRNGLDAEVTVFEGDGKTMQALQAGQLDAGFVGVSAPITSQTTDAPVKIISTNINILTDLFTALPTIKTADDLRGKCVAVSTFGGTSHGSALLSLDALKLTPEDVVITEIGGQSARIAALQGGSCGAAPVDANLRPELEPKGFNFLVDLKSAGTRWGRSGMAVTEEFLAANPNTVTVMAASVLEGQNLIWTDTENVIKKYMEFSQADEKKARTQIEDFLTTGNRTMMWTDQDFENPKRVLATVNAAIKDVPVSDAYDRSILDGLKATGYYDKLGIPKE